MDFEEAYRQFMADHVKVSTGLRLKRLKAELTAEKLFLQKVWWEVFHQFDNLYPEYPMTDYEDGSRFIDFAYVQPYFRVAIEIDGFGPHWRDIKTDEFIDQCRRENALNIDGWYVLHFAFEEVQRYPRNCQQSLQLIMGRRDNNQALASLPLISREAIYFIMNSPGPITPKQLAARLSIGQDHAIHILHALTQANWLTPASGTVRIRSYVPHPIRLGIKV